MSQTPLVAMEGMPGEIVPLRLPVPAQVFRKRSARFFELAPGHPLSKYLEAMGCLADAQAIASEGLALSADCDALPPSVPLRAAVWPRGDAWHGALENILSRMADSSLPSPAVESLAGLKVGKAEALESAADAILTGDCARIDLAATPFLSAALQVYWTVLAGRIPAGNVERSIRGCPVCGSPPVAASILGDEKLRYLTCSLCAAQWHLTRLICSNCGSTRHLTYFAIAEGASGVKAEACAKCGTYLKLLYLETTPGMDPVADDAASLALDLLLSEAGYVRSGVNLFLLSRPEP